MLNRRQSRFTLCHLFICVILHLHPSDKRTQGYQQVSPSKKPKDFKRLQFSLPAAHLHDELKPIHELVCVSAYIGEKPMFTVCYSLVLNL